MPHSDRLATQPPMGPAAVAYSANCLSLYAESVTQTRCMLDVPYGDDAVQLLDVFFPDEPVSNGGLPLPIIFFIHGGAWTNGSKEWCGFMAPAITSIPAILVCPSYRLLPDVSFPEPVVDCIAALKWVQDHRVELGAQVNSLVGRVIVAGHSAGGQIAALIATRPNLCASKGIDPDLIAGCFCVGTTFNRRMVNPNGAPEHVPPGGMDDIQPDSPLALAEAARVSFLIMWGSAEDERVPRTGRLMEEKLQSFGRDVQSNSIDGFDHFGMHLDLADKDSESSRVLHDWLSTITPHPNP